MMKEVYPRHAMNILINYNPLLLFPLCTGVEGQCEYKCNQVCLLSTFLIVETALSVNTFTQRHQYLYD